MQGTSWTLAACARGPYAFLWLFSGLQWVGSGPAGQRPPSFQDREMRGLTGGATAPGAWSKQKGPILTGLHGHPALTARSVCAHRECRWTPASCQPTRGSHRTPTASPACPCTSRGSPQRGTRHPSSSSRHPSSTSSRHPSLPGHHSGTMSRSTSLTPTCHSSSVSHWETSAWAV